MTSLTGGPDQRAMLGGFLDWYRGVAEHKLDGLTLDEATTLKTPTGVSLLGIVKHLAWVERLWFRHYLSGEAHGAVAVDASFHLDPVDTVQSVIEEYRSDCARSRRIVDEAPSLDARSTYEHAVFGTVSLGWILVHMIEETARHAGHLDILREFTDGRTGD